MDSEGHKIHFKVVGEVGYILIQRVGWLGFEYGCYITGQQVAEATQGVAENQEPMYSVDIIEHMSTPDEFSEQYVVWYVVNTKRLSDMCATVRNLSFFFNLQFLQYLIAVVFKGA